MQPFSWSASACWFGPWLLKKVASAAYPVTDGRLWNRLASSE